MVLIWFHLQCILQQRVVYYHNDAAQRVFDLAHDIANSDAKDIKEYTNGVLV